MSRRLVILPAAEDDLDAGAGFYEAQSEGLGAYFSDCLASDVESLLVSAGAHRRMYGFHRCISARFPHAVFYRVNGDVVAIYAVLDCRRRPENIRRLLRGR